MAVPEQIPVVNYVADGIVKKFDVPFEYDQQSDLHVYVDGVEPTIDKYFFADNAFNFYIAPTIGQNVKIKRITPKERDTDYNLHTNTVRPKALNTDFDRLWYVLQEVFSDVGGLSQAVQDEIIARIQGDEDLLNQLTAEISARMLGDEAVTEDLKNYVNQVVGAIINDPDFDGIDAKNVNDASGETQQQVNYNGGSKWHSRVGGYKLNERAVLTNGDIVKSTIDGNTNDPNVDMAGWRKASDLAVVESIAQLRLINNAKEGDLVYVRGYHTPTNLALAQPYDGGGVFIWVGGSTVTPVQGIIEQATGVTTGRFLRQFDDNVVNVLFCGAKRDGVTESHLEIKIALQYAAQNNMRCYAPTGTYIIGNRIDPVLSDGQSIYFYGDGFDQTIFKEKDGLTLTLGRFNMTFYFLIGDNRSLESIILKDFQVYKNGITSPAPLDDVYKFEQAHCVAIASTWVNSKIKNVIIENVKTRDKIGAGVCLTQGYIDRVNCANVIGFDYNHIGGERGDFEFQAVVTDLVLESCSGRYAQCEPNMTTAPSGMTPKAVLTNCSYDVTEFTAYVDSPSAQTIIMNNHTAKTLCLIRWAKLLVSDSSLRVTTSSNTYWEGTVDGSIIENSKITVGVNTTTNTFDSFYPRSAANVPTYLKIKNSIFSADSTANNSTTGYAVNNAAVYSGAQGYLVEFEDVKFDPIFERTASCYANGNYIFKNCKLAARSGSAGALNIGGYSTYYSNVILDSNDLTQLSAPYVLFSAANTLWSVNFKGVHDFAKSTFTSSNLPNTESCGKADGYFSSDIVPTTKGILGWRVKINKPVFGAPSEFICTTTSSTAPVYQLLNQAGVKIDTTANRPTGLTVAARGLRYLDTTLAANGKPIQYNGTAWTDSLGATV